MTHEPPPGADPPETPAPVPKVPTGIVGLDAVLLGGLPRGRTTLVSGGPGTGKTVLGLEFLCRGAQAGEPGVFVTFEERAAAVRQNALALGWDLAALEREGKLAVIHAHTPPDMVLSGEFTIDGLLAILGGQADALGARRLVLDAIDGLLRVFADPARERHQIRLLHDWLLDRGLTTVLTVKSQGDWTSAAGFLDYLTDCVICLDQRVVRQVSTRRLRVLKYRGSGFFSNEHPYVIRRGGVTMMPVSANAQLTGAPDGPVPSGVPGLDAVLGGGYRRGSCVLIGGASGTGKTTVAASFAAAAAGRGERVLYVSFEDSADSLAGALAGAGVDLRPGLAAGQLQILSALPEALGVEEHLLRIVDAMEAFGPVHVAVDPVSACVRMGSQEAAFDFLVRLLYHCKGQGVTCLYTKEANGPKPAAALGKVGVASLADTLLLLEQSWAGGGHARRLLVVKSRGGRHSHEYHRFAITGGGVEVHGTARGAEGGQP